MSRRLCRLCFLERTRPIGIFSAKGIELNIAEAIRLHFTDEVKENDHLPKMVCRDCWRKLDEFHDFYNTVNAAQNHFWLELVKNEEPIFLEINCDSVGYGVDIPSVKVEPLLDTVDSEVQSSKDRAIGNNRAFPDSDDATFCDNVDDTSIGNVPIKIEKDASTKIVVGHKSVLEAVQTSDAITKKFEKSSEEFDHLISNYMDMFCEICDHPFGTLPEASSHYLGKHKQTFALLKCCQRRLKMPGEIRDHIQYHLDPDKFRCSECSKAYTSRRKLNKHLSTHLRDKFECDICAKKFRSRDGIKNHMITNHIPTQAQHECEICKKRFILKQKLNDHVKQVHERRGEQMCHICAKVYKSKQSMLDHLKEHSDVKEPGVNCEQCGKSFRNKYLVRKHVRSMHEQDERIRECPHCQKQFTKDKTLRHHISYHHNFKLHKCDICGKECKRPNDLKEHMAIHTGVDLYQCEYCPRTFKANSNRLTHCKRMHRDEWIAARKAKLSILKHN